MTSEPTYLKDYQPTPYHIPTVELDFALHETKTRVTARYHVTAREGTAWAAPLRLAGGNLKLVSVTLNNCMLEGEDYRLVDGDLEIIKPPSAKFDIEIVTEINPEANKTNNGLYFADGIFSTQCEPEGFREMTFFLDRPDVMATYKVRLEGEKAKMPMLLANGNLVEQGDLEGGRHFALWHDPHPKPSYLFALVAADLGMIEDRFTTSEGREVALRIYVQKGKEGQAGWAMTSLINSMKWDEERFGRAYDLDIFMIVAVPTFNMGAMENKGLNIFNDKYILADPDTATDLNYVLIETVVAHEYFHNWTGNRITCRDWFQLCVKEGLTVFRDQEFTSDLRSRGVKRLEDVRRLKASQWPEDRGPLAHPPRPESFHEINNFYTPTVYEKGAEIVRMLATRLGHEGFRRGMDLYFTRHDNQAITVEDFVAALGGANDTDLSPFLDWYREAGTPIVEVERNFDAPASRFTLTLTPKAPEGPAVTQKVGKPIPLRLGLLDQAGGAVALPDDLPGRLGDDLVELGAKPLSFTLEGLKAPLIPAVLRGFSAPVQVRQSLSLDERLVLYRCDPDAYLRAESIRTAAEEASLAHLAGDPSARASFEKIAGAIAEVIADPALDPALQVMLISPWVGLADLQIAMQGVLPLDEIFALGGTVRAWVAPIINESTKRRLQSLPPMLEPYAPSTEQIAGRSLRNALRAAAAMNRDEASLGLVREAYSSASNLTDRVAALQALARHDPAERDTFLADFRTRLGGNGLLFDQLSRLQVSIDDEGDFARVERAMEDPLFALTNPNRVYALLGTFAMSHHREFHRADLSGYRFFLEKIKVLNDLNPQIAARLMTALGILPRLDVARQGFLVDELKKLAALPGCSSDLADIIGRLLQGVKS